LLGKVETRFGADIAQMSTNIYCPYEQNTSLSLTFTNKLTNGSVSLPTKRDASISKKANNSGEKQSLSITSVLTSIVE